MKMIYIIGGLKNKNVPVVANKLRKVNHEWEVFDSWYSPGPDADDYWRAYEKAKGSTYKEALASWAAMHIFEFDKFHLERATDVVLVMPCGKSAHLELGWAIGKGKKSYILFDKEPVRWDVMVQFADDVFFELNGLIQALKRN
jgi:hypothetical protein